MNIKDLEFGNVVKLRNGKLLLVCPDVSTYSKKISDYLKGFSISKIDLRNINTGGFENNLGFYDEEFRADRFYKTDGNDESKDIMKIYEDYTLQKLLWKREEDEEEDE